MDALEYRREVDALRDKWSWAREYARRVLVTGFATDGYQPTLRAWRGAIPPWERSHLRRSAAELRSFQRCMSAEERADFREYLRADMYGTRKLVP